MIVIMNTAAPAEDRLAVEARLHELGYETEAIVGEERSIIGVIGKIDPELPAMIENLPGVDSCVRVSKPFKLASRDFRPLDSVVEVGGVRIGAGQTVVMAGPCSVESEDQLFQTARAVRKAGADILRGGAFKPRTSPYQFRGLGVEGLKLLRQASDETSMPVITEVLTTEDVDAVAQYADILQIGARNMQNFILLEEAGRTNKPVLLKRGLSARVEEWLLAAEYILNTGNRNVILCERGIRTFETMTRNTLDVAVIPLIKRLSHLPIISDPSHGTGKWYLVPPMAVASVAAGCDGLIIEVHPNPDHALSDGPQSLTFENFEALMHQTRAVATALGRPLWADFAT
jgi:3-deoxy-7-phosphoheptulonate synthase